MVSEDRDHGKIILELSGINKSYGGVHALRSADFKCASGKIHAILGENGAGKSTLIKIITGVVSPDSGTIQLDGKKMAFSKPSDAMRAGIVCIFQELSLIPHLTVADNICITHPPKIGPFIDINAQDKIALEVLRQMGVTDIHPRELIKDLPLSRKQIVEIAKAMRLKPKILLLDEATSALTAADVEKVMNVLQKLKTEGITILYISHRMNEIARLADDCTVFRNGKHVDSFKNGTKTHNEIVEMMIGRDFTQVFPPKQKSAHASQPILKVKNLSWENRLKDISLSVKAGEIVGLGGLDGQGQREFLLSLFGVLKNVSGSIRLNGQETHFVSPKQAKNNPVGVALIPEDRKTEGLMLPMSIRDNLSIAIIDRIKLSIFIDTHLENEKINHAVETLNIKAADLYNPVNSLSGGNQQKVVIAKWLMTQAKLILLNDPTRGIDVGTKQEIYLLLRRLADQGIGIIFYSTDYVELINCCDQVAVFYDGGIIRMLEGDELTEKALISSALNLSSEKMIS